MTQDEAYKAWWHNEGSGIIPLPNEDMEEFAHRITQIAWSNGAFKERKACSEKFVGEAVTKLQQKQETIEGLNRDYDLLFAEHQLLLKKEWVSLTEDEIYKIAFTLESEHWKKIADAIESKLKEKNTRRQE
jgi:hypothetical protein